MKKLKVERNKLVHEIRKTTQIYAAREIDDIVDEIETAKDSAQMFKAIRTLRHFKKPKNIIVNENERVIARPEEAVEIIAKHFKAKLTDASKEHHIKPELEGPLEVSDPSSY